MAITLAGVACASDLNVTPATGAEAMYRLKTVLVSAGWTLKGSSDGSSFSTTGTDYWVNAAAVAHSQAWCRLQMPTVGGVTREILIQRNTGNTSWRVGYSYSAGFTGTANGAISATVAPTATDGQDWLSTTAPVTGGFQSGGASYVTLFGTDASYVCNIAAQNVAPYGFWLWTSGGTATGSQAFIVLDPLLSGSYPVAEADPYVLIGNPLTSSMVSAAVGGFGAVAGTSIVKGWLRKGLTGEAFAQLGIYGMENNIASVAKSGTPLGPMSADGLDFMLPVFYGRQTSAPPPNGHKGTSSLIRAVVNNRVVKDTHSVSPGTKNYVVIGDYAFDWDGSTPS